MYFTYVWEREFVIEILDVPVTGNAKKLISFQMYLHKCDKGDACGSTDTTLIKYLFFYISMISLVYSRHLSPSSDSFSLSINLFKHWHVTDTSEIKVFILILLEKIFSNLLEASIVHPPNLLLILIYTTTMHLNRQRSLKSYTNQT